MRIRASFGIALIALAAALPAHAQQVLDELIVAVTNDRAADVRRLLARGVDPDSVDPNGDPMLVLAARNGSSGAVDALLAGRARPDLPNPRGDTAMLIAALKGNLALVRRLHTAGAKLDGPGWTPLIYAATGGHEPVVRYLLEQGARIDAASPNGTTALMMAVREHRVDIADLLLARGADPMRRNDAGLTALQYAEQGNETELAARMRRPR
jgi:ankyrin repeat protein